MTARLGTGLDDRLPDVVALYRDLHAHPELAFAEHRTAARLAERLRALGLEVTTGVGGTGVVGVLRNGDGPTVLLRADMDGLPVAEVDTVAHRSRDTAVGADGVTVPVMHACGHDTHMAALVGALACLAADRSGWSGTVVAVMQPAEEVGGGSRAMLADGFLERFGPIDVSLGQHVTSAPAGHLYARGGVFMAAADSLRVTVLGRGGHGSTPHVTVDPVVIAAAIVLRLQTIVAREVAPADTAVVTVGSLHAGHQENVIPDRAELKINVRTFDPDVRARVLAAVERIVRAEAAAAGAPEEPVIAPLTDFPLLVNDVEATERVRAAFAAAFGEDAVHEAPRRSGSEDFGCFGEAAGVPSVFWNFGGLDPDLYAADAQQPEAAVASGRAPGVHSPHFVPTALDPVLRRAVEAVLVAAGCWLAD
ncbi:amidohydrolase [Actinomycetospora straminea]|uniref:M20 family metallopeptidase n=1 Tax=Actinomycetospora straminea TaxID=663607 RepID=A0ABP9F1E3_9PSEU|nr:amidohydrolase [Actinomycetospora straminea]MDD7934689.1 amidohydrolase [Actinomycetospora straminea]